MSSNEVFAEPMLDDDEYLEEYKQQLLDLQKKGLLPRLDDELTYKVYSIRGSEFGAHKSIVLTTDGTHFVTVELGFIPVDGKKHIYPTTRQLPDELKHKLEYHGDIEATGLDLIAKAVAVMKRFGSYFKFWKNCQDYCNYYLKAVGLGHTTTLTDVDKGAIAGIVTTASIVSAFLLAVMAVKKSKKS